MVGGVVRPADHLRPVFRLEPNHGSGIFVIALDPREAMFVMNRGWALLDGARYSVSFYGWDGEVEADGRVSVRCQRIDEPVRLRVAA